MPSPIVLPTLAQALLALGNAHVYRASWPLAGAVGNWSALGQKEGDIGLAFNEAESVLTAPELTGPAPHEITIMGAAPVLTMSLIMGDAALWPLLSPTGSAHGGSDYPQATVKHALAIIPDAEVGGGLSYSGPGTTTWTRVAGNGIAGGTGAGVVPVNAIWLWKCVISRPDNIPYTQNNGGKVVSTVTAKVLYDVTKVQNFRLWSVGDPTLAGATFYL